jgi:hypothetical protein
MHWQKHIRALATVHAFMRGAPVPPPGLPQIIIAGMAVVDYWGWRKCS